MAIGLGALIAALLAAGGTTAGVGVYNTESKKDEQAKKDVIKLLKQSGSPILRDMDDKFLLALAEEYDISTPSLLESITGINTDRYTSGLEGLFNDIEKLQSFLGSEQSTLNKPETLDRAAIDAASKTAFEADYAKQLGLVESGEREMLGDIQGTYDTYRKDMLQQQNLNRGQIMNAYQNAFRDQRSRAIEAGASAGLKLANNVNALLSAQNAQRATSLETSNQLANMVLQQQNAAFQARSQAKTNRLDLAGRFSEKELKDYQAGQYGREAAMYDRQMEDYQTNLNDRLAGLNLGSTNLRNIGTTIAGQTGFSPLNTSSYRRPILGATPKPTTNYAFSYGTPGAMSTDINSNFLNIKRKT